MFRHFTDATVGAVPGASRLDAIKAALPVTIFSTSYVQGQRVSDIDYEYDGYSYRYAVVNLAGNDQASLERDVVAVRQQLGFRLEPVGADTM